MSTGEKRPFKDAAADAEKLRELFAGYFDRWEIGGSVRRRRPEVGDVEHVIIPKRVEVPSGGLFAPTKPANGLWIRAEQLLAEGIIAKKVYRTAKGAIEKWGEKQRGLLFNGFSHEIYTATPDNWGATLLIRTGPAEFSKEMVTRFLNGGRYRQQDGVLTEVATGKPVSVPDEETYFRMLGMEFIPPEERR